MDVTMIIHNGRFAECKVLENFQGLCGPSTRTWGPRKRTRTCKLVLEDKDFPRGLQHCMIRVVISALHWKASTQWSKPPSSLQNCCPKQLIWRKMENAKFVRFRYTATKPNDLLQLYVSDTQYRTSNQPQHLGKWDKVNSNTNTTLMFFPLPRKI